MATVNLVPSTQYLAAARSRRSFLLLSAAGIVVVLALAWGALLLWGSMVDKQLADAEGRTNALQTKLAAAEPAATRISLFENRVGLLAALLKKHTAIDPLLVELEKRIPTTVSLNSLTLSASPGSMALNGVAPTPDDVAQLVASLNSTPTHPTLFTHIQLGSIERKDVTQDGQAVGTNYVFSLSGVFNPTDLQVSKTTN
jgi:Tfp pilus assembly protein PilN